MLKFLLPAAGATGTVVVEGELLLEISSAASIAKAIITVATILRIFQKFIV
jgi:hypothetical protein